MKFDDGKPKLTLVPRKIIFAIAKIREYGVKKYSDPDNWKTVEKERYRDAAYRHFMAYLDDPEGVDTESGLPHLWHLACNVSFLCEMEDFKKENKEKNAKDFEDSLAYSQTQAFDFGPPIGVSNCYKCKYKGTERYLVPCNTCINRDSLYKIECLNKFKKNKKGDEND